MEPVRPAASIMADAGLVVLPGEIRPRVGHGWLVGWQGSRAVLRAVPLPSERESADRSVAGVAWLHDFLGRLTGDGFAWPVPLPAFRGSSWTVEADYLWEIVSFVPGQVIGWQPEPDIEEIGAVLARFHQAAGQARVTGQRPGALTLADALATLAPRQLAAVGVAPATALAIRQQAESLAGDLSELAEATGERIVIHGDFTAHNVVASGMPPKVTGVIDFAGAHADRPMADVGYGLWRSGRPCQDADLMDLSRVARFVRGYASVRPIPRAQARAIPVYLRGRGLQMIAKRVLAGLPETGMLAQVQWLTANMAAVTEAIDAAVS